MTATTGAMTNVKVALSVYADCVSVRKVTPGLHSKRNVQRTEVSLLASILLSASKSTNRVFLQHHDIYVKLNVRIYCQSETDKVMLMFSLTITILENANNASVLTCRRTPS